MRVVVVTVVRGRHEHLRRQIEGLDRSDLPPDEHIVVAVDDPAAADLVAAARVPTRVCEISSDTAALPIGSARNSGAREAIDAHADVIVFLDVDCIPGRGLVARYVQAARMMPTALLSGPVAYLDPPPPQGYDLDTLDGAPGHPARPVPDEDGVVPGADHRLFWSLSFAVTSATWLRLGGFCEQYVGYGAEDTDLGQLAAQRGIDHAWVGGAWAYHQFHPAPDPPVDKIADVIRNANLFHARWGWWPMSGWLTAFEARGLARLRRGRWEQRYA